MKCTLPVCIHYCELEKPNNLKKSTCTLKGIEITYKNIEEIQNCQDHQTFQQNKDKWKIILENF